MRKLVVGTFATLDGVMQAPGGPDEDRDGGFQHGGWLVPYFDEAFLGSMTEWAKRADAFLLGRKTYGICSSGLLAPIHRPRGRDRHGTQPPAEGRRLEDPRQGYVEQLAPAPGRPCRGGREAKGRGRWRDPGPRQQPAPPDPVPA